MRTVATVVSAGLLVVAAGCDDESPGGPGGDANQAPTAAASVAVAVVRVGDEVVISGEASSDPDGDALRFTWTLTSAPDGFAAGLGTPTGSSASLSAYLAGEYQVTLVVSDGRLDSEPAVVGVVAADPPVAHSSGPQLVDVGDVVQLDGGGSRSPDDKPLSYAWTVTFVDDGQDVALSEASAVMPTFTASRVGSYRATLIVDDGDLESDPHGTTVLAAAGTVEAISTAGATIAEEGIAAVWSGSEVLLFGGIDVDTYETPATGHRYDPSTDTWTAMSAIDAPVADLGHTAVWTGTEMIVWGGRGGPLSALQNTGSRYDPATDTWTPVSTTDAPSARAAHVAVWTGSRMFVWGGAEGPPDASVTLDTGAAYDPETDTWTPLSMSNVPLARAFHQAFWTGDRVLVWGGLSTDAGFTPTGALYDPETDTWEATSVDGAPVSNFVAAWAGSKLLVFDGRPALYDPVADAWSTASPPPEEWPRSVRDMGQGRPAWTGEEVIEVGLYFDPLSGDPSPARARAYRSSTDEWTRALSTTGMPDDRTYTVAVWTGSSVFLWGGSGRGEYHDGYLLTP